MRLQAVPAKPECSSIQLDLEQGSLERTDRPLDVGIEGQGFFKVKVMDTVGDGTA